MRKLLKRLLCLLVITYFAFLTWLYFNQQALLYFPDKEIKDISSYNLNNTQEVFLQSEDGVKIQTWYHPASEGKPMVVWFHGNSYNISYKAHYFRKLLDMGYGIIAPSWRGFGKSEGAPSKEGIFKDARAAVNYLKQMGYKTEDTILIGESLGSGVATKIATENKFKGLMLITPYTSVADRAQEIYWYLPVKPMVTDDFNCIDNIENINTSLLIVHGTNDYTIPHQHSEKLIARAHEPKKLVLYDGKAHSNLDAKKIFKEMDNFLNSPAPMNHSSILKHEASNIVAMLEELGWQQ
jgi:alpha-beta hydrolase superfamily lysophospholipase